MKNYLAVLLLLIIIPFYSLHAQGFDWQYSYRMPESSPRLFLGGNIAYDISQYNADVNFSENVIPCCRFKDGSGNNMNLGVSAEYWLYGGEYALTLDFQYSGYDGEFSANPDPVYYKNDTLKTQIKSEADFNYFGIRFGGKYRIELTHFWVGVGVKFDINTSGNFANSEIVVSPNHSFNDGSIKREINQGKLEKLTSVLLTPDISLGYDFNLGLGLYASPNISFSYSLNSIIKNDSWHSLNVGFGIKVLKGIRRKY